MIIQVGALQFIGALQFRSDLAEVAAWSGQNQGGLSMPIGTIIMIAVLIASITFLALVLRPPPLYSDPEALPKHKDADDEKDK